MEIYNPDQENHEEFEERKKLIDHEKFPKFILTRLYGDQSFGIEVEPIDYNQCEKNLMNVRFQKNIVQSEHRAFEEKIFL